MPASGEQQRLLASLLEYGQTLWPELASGDVALSSLSAADGHAGSSPGSDAGGNSSGSDTGNNHGLPGRPTQAAAAPAAEPPRGVPAPPGSPAADFEAWAWEQGVASAITIASFGALRGCAAARDVQPGEPLLSIPSDVLIYEDSVRQTDLVSFGLAGLGRRVGAGWCGGRGGLSCDRDPAATYTGWPSCTWAAELVAYYLRLLSSGR